MNVVSERTRTIPVEEPYDLAATLYRALGLDPDDEFITPEGRPIKIANNGKLIHELL